MIDKKKGAYLWSLFTLIVVVLLSVSGCSTQVDRVKSTTLQSQTVIQPGTITSTNTREPTGTKTFPDPAQLTATIATFVTPSLIRPTATAEPKIQNNIELLPSGLYLMYFNFLDEGSSVHAISLTGKDYVLAPLSLDLLVTSENGRFFLYGNYIYDFIKNISRQINLNVESRYFGLSSDGKMLAAILRPNKIEFKKVEHGWILIENGNPSSGDLGRFLAWAPDNFHLAYTSCYNSPHYSKESGIYISDISSCSGGQESCNIAIKGPYQKGSCPNYLSWSPDGKYIAGGTSLITVSNIVTGEEKTLEKALPGMIHGLSWSPDGQWIGYAADETVNGNSATSIYIVPVTGGKPVLLRANTNSQVRAWLNVLPKFTVGIDYLISIMGDGKPLTTEPSVTSKIVKVLHLGEKIRIIDGPKVEAEETWWKIQSGTESGWIIDNPDWFRTE